MTFELLMHAAFVADEIWSFMLETARTSYIILKHLRQSTSTIYSGVLPAAHPEEPSYTYAEIPAVNKGIVPVAPEVFLIFIHFF